MIFYDFMYILQHAVLNLPDKGFYYCCIDKELSQNLSESSREKSYQFRAYSRK